MREWRFQPSGEYVTGAPRSLAYCVRGEIFASASEVTSMTSHVMQDFPGAFKNIQAVPQRHNSFVSIFSDRKLRNEVNCSGFQ